MDKYQVALNNVKRVYVESEHYDEEDIAILQELVDKETPMKPIRKGKLNSLYCPKCDRPLMFEGTICCDKCGQKLDWSDNDE